MTLDLQPKAYAIFAREADNELRSNFCGKSSLEEAIDFALYGRLADEFRGRKKEWISRGEKSGEVELELSDGSRIQRSQSLAGSERLWYYPPGDPTKGATQEEAQKRIEELVGLGREDFVVTRYFRQGAMSRLITLDPGPRLDLVAGWLRLGPLQECEDDAAGVLREVARRRDDKRAEAKAAEDAATATLERAGLSGIEGIDGRIEAEEACAQEMQARVDAAQAALQADRAREESRAAAEAYERVVEQGRRLTGELVGMMPETLLPESDKRLGAKALAQFRDMVAEEAALVEEVHAVATGEHAEANREAGVRRRLLAGEFDGRCPLAGAPCPSRAFVDEAGRASQAAHQSAAEGLRRATERVERKRADRDRAQRLLADVEHKIRRLGELRAEAARLKPAHERWRALSESSVGASEARASHERAAAEHRQAFARVEGMRQARAAAQELLAKASEAKRETEALEASVRVAAAAAAIFGKHAAQRRTAEDALAEIEGSANDMMAESGVPLSVRVTWAREGSGAAATCAACGDAFPRSEKVKACARCGAERGPNLVHKLLVEPSAQSGGARDLCGIFVQLAAAEWLVGDRGARWGTAMLDEPLAALDPALRKALAAHLPAVLRRSGVAQAFVIGHDRAALDALQGRIQITSKDGWSTATVVA